jgi:DNA-binding transcriptional LysR family regulator
VGDAAQKALQALRAGVARPRFDAATSTRAFSVYMSDVGQIVLLPPLLARLKVEAPHVSLRVTSIPRQSPHALLETGEVDLAVGHLTTLTTGFYQKRLLRERYVCAVRRDHPAFVNGMTLKAFQSVPHAVTDSTGMAHELLDRKLARQGIHRPVKLYVPQFIVLPMVVAHSDLLVVMPERLAASFSALLPLKVMSLPATIPAYEVKLYWHARYRQDPANRWLRALFVELFSDT